jgi:hypothetical protein
VEAKPDNLFSIFLCLRYHSRLKSLLAYTSKNNNRRQMCSASWCGFWPSLLAGILLGAPTQATPEDDYDLWLPAPAPGRPLPLGPLDGGTA